VVSHGVPLIPRLSFVLPAYGEAKNLPVVLPRVLAQQAHCDELEVIVVDDHSPDDTFAVLAAWCERDPRIKALRLARNSGSHMAVLCGLSVATGDAVIVLASDGQDPPEFTPELLRSWGEGKQVVWAVRSAREGETLLTRAFSRLYYLTMNRWSSVRLPPAGADFLLLDRRVVRALVEIPERNTSLLALITWLGFPQAELPYVKEARLSGRTKWTFRKKVKLALDSLLGFSTAPLRATTGLGFVFGGGGFLYALLLVINRLTHGALFGQTAIEGWSALMVALLVSTGTLMIMLGVIGEYIWRALEEVRGRPRFLTEAEINLDLPDGARDGRAVRSAAPRSTPQAPSPPAPVAAGLGTPP
jgi:glycosyltransferase involved in cell wall biosynthesis